MFDDHTGGAVKAADGFPGSVAVGDVVVGKFFAVQLVVAGQKSRCNISFTIEGGFLVRIFAVTHVLHLDPLTSQAFRELRTCRDVVALHAGQVVGNHGVIVSGMNEHFLCQFQSGFRRNVALFFDFFDDFSVVAGRNNNGDAFMVLRSSANHSGAADINVFDGVFEGAVRVGDGLFERIQVHCNDVDGINFKLLQRFHMFRNGAAGKNAGMDLRVQCFDSSVEHFREAGVVGNLLYGNACLSDEFCSSAGGQNVVSEFCQGFCKFNDAGFIRAADQRLFFHIVHFVRNFR